MKTIFSKQLLFVPPAILITAIVLLSPTTGVGQATLTGTVVDESGSAVENANVWIQTATPKAGKGYLCPSCYSDCTKSARTDQAGKFEIQDLDESLTFTVLIAKERFRASLVRVDPVVDELNATLKPYKTDVAEKQKMQGTILDEDGKPINGAIVWISGAKQGESKWYGQVKHVDRVSITDKDGKFLLTSKVPYDEWELTARASGYCQNKLEHQPTGSKPYEIRLKRGVIVTGKVVDAAGKPATKQLIGIIQRDRGPENWVGERLIATDKQGRFTFTAVLPDTEWSIYTAIDGKPDVEFFQSEFFDSGTNDTIQDLGKFEVKGHGKLSGKLVLPPGESLPKELRVSVSRKYAWKSQTATVDANGSFSLPNLPMGEPLEIFVSVEGFQLDQGKQKLQQSSENQLGIFLDREKTEIEIPLKRLAKLQIDHP